MKRGRKTAVVTTLLVLGVIVLGGCGGSGGSGGGKRLTKEELAAKLNAICAAYSQRELALDPGVGSSGRERYLEDLLPI